MDDRELYRHVLGLEEPWRVERVELDMRQEMVGIWVEHKGGLNWSCPECGELSSVYDHGTKRVCRHLDSCQFKTYLHARVPQVKCRVHGVKQVKVDWTEVMPRFMVLFERLAIMVLKEANVEGAVRVLRISWGEAWNIMERPVKRGRKRKEQKAIKKMGVGEKSLGKGHSYFTLVNDLEVGRVDFIADDRRKESLDEYFSLLSASERDEIEAIGIDVWDTYLAYIWEHVPESEERLVFDRYDLMTHLVKAVDTVRKQEHRELKREGQEVLTGTKYLWLYSWEDLPAKQGQLFFALKKKPLRTGQAWALKESLRELWSYRSISWVEKHFYSWYAWAIRSRQEPVKQVARMFRKYLPNILTYLKYRITNTVSEELNLAIQTVKKMDSGFRNREHFKTAIYFHCGGLGLCPVTHRNVR